MQLATWNVNSIKVRLGQVLDWLKKTDCDALVMQETKCVDELFPFAEFTDAGYTALSVGQKTYNGVALVTRDQTVANVDQVVCNIPGYTDPQKRFIAATLTPKVGSPVRFAGAYFPNGQAVGCDKYLYKLDWISALSLWAREELLAGSPLVLAGDFNIAPTDEDLWDAASREDFIHISPPEREAYQRLLSLGLKEAWNASLHAPGTYTWWDYRNRGFELNQGMRIDHILTTPELFEHITRIEVDTTVRSLEKPSDHAPVVMELSSP